MNCSCSMMYSTVCDMRRPEAHRIDCPKRLGLQIASGQVTVAPLHMCRAASAFSPQTIYRENPSALAAALGDQDAPSMSANNGKAICPDCGMWGTVPDVERAKRGGPLIAEGDPPCPTCGGEGVVPSGDSHEAAGETDA